MDDDGMGPTLQEIEAGHRPEWKGITDRSPISKNQWAHWISLVVNDVVLRRHWESVVPAAQDSPDTISEAHGQGKTGRAQRTIVKKTSRCQQKYGR